jgi:integrase
LESTTEQTVVGEVSTLDPRITQYEWKCKKRGLQQNTIDLRKYHLNKLVKDGADLNNPDNVEEVLATKEYPTATKWLLVNTYRSYTKMFNIQWEPIRIKYQPKIPWLPTQEDCLIFIGALTKTLSIFCRVLYETGARRGEACKIEWGDIDAERHTIAINHPEKGSNPRVLRVSKDCIDLVNGMHKRKNDSYVFNPNPNAYGTSFYRRRRKIADINGKPQFLKIHFHTFRHVRGTLDVRDGVPLLEVKERLGHRYIANTEKYVHWKSQYYHEEDNKFYSASVSTDEEADKLIENGWKWELTNPNTGRMHFKKPRFV